MITLPKELVESKKIREGDIPEIAVQKVREYSFGILQGL